MSEPPQDERDDEGDGTASEHAPTDPIEAALARAKVQQKLFGGELTGPKIGRYQLRERVGAGAMGAVYLARDVELRRDVALKVIQPRSEGEQARTVRRRLLREARAMAQLRHPNVIAVHEAAVIDDQAFIAMEYVDGASLREWLDAEVRDWRQILDVFRQAGRGLAAAHEVGLVHRDFKPDNALIDGEGRVQVTDFGVAQPLEVQPTGVVVNEDGPISMTMGATDLSRAGTPRYMAPEQYAGEEIDARTDQFAFCVALFEALYREPPFAGDTLTELARAAAGGEVHSPKDDHGVARWLHRVLMRGLSADPAERFESMDEVLEALKPPARPARRWLWPLVAIAAAVAGAAAISLSRPADDDPAPAGSLAVVASAPRASTTADERTLEMAAALVGDALSDAVAAALRSGNAEGAGSAQPVAGPEACRGRQPACRILGRCSHRDGACVALASEQCQQAMVCKLSGMCSAVGGSCVVGSDEDCASSRICERQGRCAARDGDCVKAADENDDAPEGHADSPDAGGEAPDAGDGAADAG